MTKKKKFSENYYYSGFIQSIFCVNANFYTWLNQVYDFFLKTLYFKDKTTIKYDLQMSLKPSGNENSTRAVKKLALGDGDCKKIILVGAAKK